MHISEQQCPLQKEWLEESTGSVSITHCTFQSNSATFGGVLGLYKSTGNIGIMISGGREWRGGGGGGGRGSVIRSINCQC